MGKKHRSVAHHIPTLIERDGPYCHYCGLPFRLSGRNYPSTYTCEHIGGRTMAMEPSWPVVDHVIPVISGGLDDLANFVLACNTCNGHKGARPYTDFVRITLAWRERTGWDAIVRQICADHGY